jgi:hypothetical protein
MVTAKNLPYVILLAGGTIPEDDCVTSGENYGVFSNHTVIVASIGKT